MRVLIAQARASAAGGAEDYANALGGLLAKMGHDVGWIDVEGHRWPDGRQDRINIGPVGRALWNWALVCRALPQIATSYDRVVLAYGEGPLLKVPTLTIRHAPALFSTDARALAALGAKPTAWRKSYVRLCSRLARWDHNTSATLANTAWTADMARQICGGSVPQVLYPPLSIATGKTGPKDPFRMIALGRIVPNKRLHDAVRVLDDLCARGLPATLEICGRADSRFARRLLSALATHPHIKLTPNATNEQKLTALSGATLGLHMYQSEHFGIAVAEMIENGVVPLVYNDGGVRELVTPACLRFQNTDQAAAHAARLLQSPDEVAKHRKLLREGDALNKARAFDREARQALASFLERAGFDCAA